MKPIGGFENYLIDERGNVFSTESGRFITPYEKRGYLRVRLSKGGKRYDFGVHKLVAMTYLSDSYADGLEVNHKDANKHNNHVSNLEWLTHEQNVQLARNASITVEYPDGTIITYPSRISLAKVLWGADTSMHNNMPKYLRKGKIPKFGIRIVSY